jgi:hypothetical protein
LLSGSALAEEPSTESEWTDYSADTLGSGKIRLGLLHQEIGILGNLQVSTSTLAWVVGFANASGKVKAIDTERLDLSLELSGFSYNLERLGVPEGIATARPLGWTLSWNISPRWDLHIGSTSTHVELTGQVTLDQVGESLTQVLAVDLGPELEDLLDDAGSVYGGVSLDLDRALLAAEYRWSPKSSVVLISRTYVGLEGRVDAGLGNTEDGVSVGAAAHFNLPLSDWLDSVTSISYQHSWERLHLRLGLVMPSSVIEGLVIPPGGRLQALSISWLL